MIAALALADSANGQLVTGWGYETGFVSGTLTAGTAGSFGTTGVTANAAPRALLASPIDFADVGDMALFSGTVSLQNAPGNQQFRFGLFNPNGQPTGTLSGGIWSGANATNWRGYMVQVGGGGTGANNRDDVKGRNAGTNAWILNGDAYSIGVGPGNAASPPANTPYNFTLKLTRTAPTSVKVDYTFVGGSINRSGSFTDSNAGASATVPSFSAVGFLINGNTGSGQFSNVSAVAPKELRLRVNTTTGAVSIVNPTDVALDINYYEIRSAMGALNLASWSSFDDGEGGDPVGAGWEEAGGSNANILSETRLFGVTSLSPTNTIGLGNAFSVGGNPDLTFSYGLLNQTTLTSAFVEYVTGGVPGDYNGNNVIDTADYVVWRKSVGEATIPNRGAGISVDVGQADYDFWRSHFGAITGSGSGSVVSGGAVPEPATAGLVVLAWILSACTSRTRAI